MGRFGVGSWVALAIALLAVAPPADAAKLALVIGNSRYATVGALPNPANDAQAMARTLEAIGFRVKLVTDARKSDFETALAEFGHSVGGSDQVVVYYAGHGVQAAGRNYLIPVDARLQEERTLRLESVDLDLVMDQIERAAVRVVILDACRNNPFPATSRGGVRGLAAVTAPSGSLIAYSTAPGQTASDGTSSNGLYTAALLKAIGKSAPIESVFKEVRRTVSQESGGQQVPWESSSLTGDLVLTAPNGTAPALPPVQTPPPGPAAVAPPPPPPPPPGQDDNDEPPPIADDPPGHEPPPGPMRAVRERVRERWQAKDYAGARRICEEARQSGAIEPPGIARLDLMIARTYAAEGNTQRALDELTALTRDRPRSPPAAAAHLEAAGILAQLQRPAEACAEIAAFHATIQRNGQPPQEQRHPKLAQRADHLAERLKCAPPGGAR